MSMLAARISWTWDFKGPCKSIDTGVSLFDRSCMRASTSKNAAYCRMEILRMNSYVGHNVI